MTISLTYDQLDDLVEASVAKAFARHMTPAQAFRKLSTEGGVREFCKLVQSGDVENPFAKSDLIRIIEFQAEANFSDQKLSKNQKFSRYISGATGARNGG